MGLTDENYDMGFASFLNLLFNTCAKSMVHVRYN